VTSAPFAPPGHSSTQERLLEGELKLRHRTGRRGEDLTQMLDSLAEGIGLRTGGRYLPATQNAAQFVQAPPQAGEQVIHRFQRQRQVERERGGADAGLREQRRQERPEPWGRERVPWQHCRQKQGERVPATAALAAVGTEDPLAPDRLAGGRGRIVAVKQAVPVQGFGVTAAGTALLLKRKSSCWRAGSSRTKRNLGAFMPRVSARSPRQRRVFYHGAWGRRDSGERDSREGRTAQTALCPHCHRKRVRTCELNSAEKRHFLRRHCGP